MKLLMRPSHKEPACVFKARRVFRQKCGKRPLTNPWWLRYDFRGSSRPQPGSRNAIAMIRAVQQAVRGTPVPHIVSCILSVAAVALTIATAGRLLGISLTAIASALIAFSMPPVFSLRVANSGDLLMLVAQGLAEQAVKTSPRNFVLFWNSTSCLVPPHWQSGRVARARAALGKASC